MNHVEISQNGFMISTNPALLQVDMIHQYLSTQSYWAQGRTLETVKTSIEHSLCFGVYAESQQVGFARVVTDYATFGWLCDVFILESRRGKGLGKWLVGCVVDHPALKSIRRLLLATRDAGGLYRVYGGFETLPNPERWMVRMGPG
jgi:hypothetical protein